MDSAGTDTAGRYAEFAVSQARNGHSAVYQDWARGVSGDPEVCALLDTLPPPKRQPNLLFAAARLVGASADSWSDVRPWLLTAWPDVEREMHGRSAFTATMAELRRRRGVVWLSNEGWTVLPDVAAQLPEGSAPQFILARDGVPVALTDPHGRSVLLL